MPDTLTLNAALRKCRALNRADKDGDTYEPEFVHTGAFAIAVFDASGEFAAYL